MSEVEPAIAHLACPTCDEIIDVPIIVSAEIVEGSIRASVQDIEEQVVWDHVLAMHGPDLGAGVA